MEVNDKILVPGTLNGWGEDLYAKIIEIEQDNEDIFVVAQYFEPKVNSGYTIRCNIQLINKES